mgnify:CR=1 FL=1
MKKTILKFAVTTCIMVMSLTSFAQQDKNAEKERKNVAEAQKKLGEARADSEADYTTFKKNAETKVSEIQGKIDEVKAKMSKESKEVKKKYNKQVLALEKKMDALKKKIGKISDTKTEKWVSFKHEFTHDMDELGHAIKDIGVDNKK